MVYLETYFLEHLVVNVEAVWQLKYVGSIIGEVGSGI